MEDLMPGKDGALEFGAAIGLKGNSFIGKFIVRIRLKINYWKNRLYSFPFYRVKPAIINANFSPTQQAIGWYLVVPGNKIVRPSKEHQAKIAYLKSGKK